jgi:hypothetical protein
MSGLVDDHQIIMELDPTNANELACIAEEDTDGE